MITWRRVSLVGAIGLFVVQPPSGAQPGATIRRVGLLSLVPEAAGERVVAAFKQGMRDLGWLEGKNIEYRFASADGDATRLDAAAADLIGQEVDVIVAAGSVATRAAQRATTTIPIVMASASNAVGNGFVASLAKPGGNITGTSSQTEDVLRKLIEILHEVTPNARRFAFLLNESNQSHDAFWAVAQSACAALDLVAIRVVASAPAQLGTAVEQIVRQRSQAVVVISDPLYFGERAKLQALTQTASLPVAYGLREHVVAGGLLSYATDLAATFRHTAKFVDKILKGAKPTDLPVEQPTTFELVVNLKAAKALGITVPQSVLVSADEVID